MSAHWILLRLISSLTFRDVPVVHDATATTAGDVRVWYIRVIRIVLGRVRIYLHLLSDLTCTLRTLYAYIYSPVRLNNTSNILRQSLSFYNGLATPPRSSRRYRSLSLDLLCLLSLTRGFSIWLFWLCICVQLEGLSAMLHMVLSGDGAVQLEATTQFRKLLSIAESWIYIKQMTSLDN